MLLPRLHLERRYHWLRSARAIASFSVLVGAAILLVSASQLRARPVDFGSSFAMRTLVEAAIPLAVALASWSITVVTMRRCVRAMHARPVPQQAANFSIRIAGRGEGLVYEDEDGTFIFEIHLSSRPMKLHAYDCRDESFNPRILTDPQRSRIIPRIVLHMDPWHRKVEVLTEAPDRPLRNVDDIMRERFKARTGRSSE
ncbi:hypothetical protein [Roseimicrobium sp. ORNL1]|uniref:hypothetical protein n=1 Tax=Roseimicrobium sp. ORNL1 TaxID=2711231 RepID=UPI001980C6A5|nr:hypothetical protein [Roseimicrobium sp. ORNL1]